MGFCQGLRLTCLDLRCCECFPSVPRGQEVSLRRGLPGHRTRGCWRTLWTLLTAMPPHIVIGVDKVSMDTSSHGLIKTLSCSAAIP